MCHPIAMMALTVASTAVSYQSDREAGKANAQIAENNARLAEADAVAAQAMGDRESQQQTWQTRMLEGRQRAAIAAAGIDSQIGTPAELLGETALFGEVDQQTIRLNTARRAWGFSAQAQNTRNQASVDRYTTRQKGTATILGGMTSLASQGMQMRGG